MKPRKIRKLTIGAHEFAISKVVEVDVPRKLLFLEEMADGTLRLSYSKAFGVSFEDLASMAVTEAVEEL